MILPFKGNIISTQWVILVVLYCLCQCRQCQSNEQAFVNRNATILEKYKEKGLRSKRRNSPYIFQVVESLPTKACSYLLSSFFREIGCNPPISKASPPLSVRVKEQTSIMWKRFIILFLDCHPTVQCSYIRSNKSKVFVEALVLMIIPEYFPAPTTSM